MKNENAEYIVFNVPNLDMQSIFPELKSDISKVCFLLNQINFFTPKGGYTINVRKHDYMFGQKGFTSKVLKILVENNIVKCSNFYVPTKTSKNYSLINPFDASKENDNKGLYISCYFQKNELPTFIQRWLADNYTVQDANDTLYVSSRKNRIIIKDGAEHHVNESLIKELQGKIKQMEIENKELQARLEAAMATITANREARNELKYEAVKAKIKPSRKVSKVTEVITQEVEITQSEPLNEVLTDDNTELVTLENCGDLKFENEVETSNIIDSKGLSVNELYYLLEENGYDLESMQYNSEYIFENFKLKMIEGQIVIEGDVNSIQTIIDKNADAFLNRKKLAVA